MCIVIMGAFVAIALANHGSDMDWLLGWLWVQKIDILEVGCLSLFLSKHRFCCAGGFVIAAAAAATASAAVVTVVIVLNVVDDNNDYYECGGIRKEDCDNHDHEISLGNRGNDDVALVIILDLRLIFSA
jgi:hypothetical protein